MSNTIYGQPIMMGGGSGLNIAYGTTPPTDTSKLWVPLTKKPDNVEISAESMQGAVDEIQNKASVLAVAANNTAAVAINGKVYIFGGYKGSNLDTIQEYDPVEDTIVTKTATLASAAQGACVVAIDGKAYIFGGKSNDATGGSKKIQEYDPVEDTIVTKTATLTKGCISGSAVAINGKAYIFGGAYISSTYTYTTEDIQEYDPVEDTIVTKTATLTRNLYMTAAVVIDNKAYIFGGRFMNGSSGGGSRDTIQEYDPSTDTITTMSATLPTICYDSAAVSINNKAYIFGGRVNANGARSATIDKYDPSTDTITTMSATLATAAYGISAAELVDKAYIFGGNGDDGRLDTIQEYIPQEYLGANHLKVFASVYKSEAHQGVTNIVNGKKEQIKLYMTSAFIGDEDGYAKAQDAYVYDEANSEWQVLGGTSMTTDMLNALAELEVT